MERKFSRATLFVTLLWMLSFSAFAENDNRDYSVKVVSIDSDSVTLAFINNTSSPAYLFDSYMRGHSIFLPGKISYLYRYNKNTQEYKFSYLPFIQFLGCEPSERMLFVGEEAVLRNNNVPFSFTEILPNDSLLVKIPVDDLYSDVFYKDVDMKSYTIIDENYRLIDDVKLKRIKKIKPADKLTLEFAIYHNIDYFNNYQEIKNKLEHVQHILVRDKATTDYDIVTCTINLPPHHTTAGHT